MRRFALAGLTTLIACLAAPPEVVAGGDMIAANTVPNKRVWQPEDQKAQITDMLRAIKLPPGFKIALLAIVPGARDMAVTRGGYKVFVGTGDADNYVVNLVAPEGPVRSVKTFAPSISKIMPHGVCFAPDGTLYVVEQNRVLAYADAAEKVFSPDLMARVVVPQGGLIPVALQSHGHSTRACRIGPDGALYVTLGQPSNVPTAQQWQAFTAGGVGSIQRINTDGSGRSVYATGLRNSVGLDFNPKDKTLWFTDNQVDQMGDDIPPGELNRATGPGGHYGFPWYGGGHTRTNEWANSTPPANVIFPQIEMVAHAADLGMTFYRGWVFPRAYHGGIFSAQRGSWNRSVPIGARIMFTTLKPDGTADHTVPFAEGWLAPDGTYRGRPVDVAETPDGSLLVSDNLVGAIYRISYTHP